MFVGEGANYWVLVIGSGRVDGGPRVNAIRDDGIRAVDPLPSRFSLLGT